MFTLVKALNLESVERTLEELREYVVTHFSNNQALMEKSGYPAFEEHLKLHEAFGASVADFLSSGGGMDRGTHSGTAPLLEQMAHRTHHDP